MTNHSYSKNIADTSRVVKSTRQDCLPGLALMSSIPGPGTLLRAEQTRGAVAVSGISGEGSGRVNSFPDFPQTNSKAVVNSDGFSIGGPGPLEGCQGAGGGS